MRHSRNRIFLVILAALAITASVVGVAVTHAAKTATRAQASAHTIAASHGPFGGTAGLNSLRRLDPVPDDVARRVQQLAVFDGTDPAKAGSDVRLVRAGAGTDWRVYAFNDDRGNPCLVVPDLTGFCNPDGGTGVAGLNWSIGGGDSSHPSSFIAVYSDNVSGLALAVDGVAETVAMANNVAYASFPTASAHAEFTVTYIDGSQRTITTNLQG